MHRSTFIAAVTAAAIGLTTVAAMANSRGPDFSTLDADGNGEVTLNELQNAGSARFTNADTDGDGFLTEAELVAASQSGAQDRAARMMERMDANDDGKLSQEEVQERRRGDPSRFFERMDADNSGGISEEEFEEARANMRERNGGKRKGKN